MAMEGDQPRLVVDAYQRQIQKFGFSIIKAVDFSLWLQGSACDIRIWI